MEISKIASSESNDFSAVKLTKIFAIFEAEYLLLCPWNLYGHVKSFFVSLAVNRKSVQV